MQAMEYLATFEQLREKQKQKPCSIVTTGQGQSILLTIIYFHDR